MKTEVDKILDKYDFSNEDEIYLKKGDEEYVLTEGKVKKLTAKFIDLCSDEAGKRRDFGMNAKVVEMLIDIKKAWWPATQKSLTANIDFDKQLEKWYLTQRELLDKSNQEVMKDA